MTSSYREVRRHVFAPLVSLSLETENEPPSPSPSTDAAEPPAPAPDPEEIAAAAFEEGFRRGYEEGKRLAEEEQRKSTRKLARLARTALQDASELLRGLEQELVELSLAIAEKVLEREVRLDPEIVLSVVRAALDEIDSATAVRVRVNPQDYELVASWWETVVRKPLANKSQVVADERVQAGGCVIETQLGQVDAQLSTKLRQIVNTYRALLEGEPV